MTIPVKISDSRGPSAYDSDLDLNECVEKYYPLVLALARQAVPTTIGPIDFEDIAQEASIKLWLIAQKQPIESPKAYIRRIVHTVVADMARKYKPNLYQAFPTDEDGEVQEDNLVGISGAELRDPETILEEKEAAEERMQELAGVISTFHPRQKHAAVSTLKERVDDLIQFVRALQANDVDCELQWPENKQERQCLQASYSPAKRKIAQYMNICMSKY